MGSRHRVLRGFVGPAPSWQLQQALFQPSLLYVLSSVLQTARKQSLFAVELASTAMHFWYHQPSRQDSAASCAAMQKVAVRTSILGSGLGRRLEAFKPRNWSLLQAKMAPRKAMVPATEATIIKTRAAVGIVAKPPFVSVPPSVTSSRLQHRGFNNNEHSFSAFCLPHSALP